MPLQSRTLSRPGRSSTSGAGTPAARRRRSRARPRAARGRARACGRSSTSPPCRSARSCRARARRRRRTRGSRGRARGRARARGRSASPRCSRRALPRRCARARRGTGRRSPRLVGARDLLAEHVDRRELSLRVQPAARRGSVVERRARDVAGREPSHDGLRDGRQQPDDRAVEESHRRGDGRPNRSVQGSVGTRHEEIAHSSPPSPWRAPPSPASSPTRAPPGRRSRVTEREFKIGLSATEGPRRPGSLRRSRTRASSRTRWRSPGRA